MPTDYRRVGVGITASQIYSSKEVNMKRTAISIVLAVLLLTMGLATTLPVGAATEDDIEASIEGGLTTGSVSESK